MSYSFNNPCYLCAKSKDAVNPCKDAEKVQESISKIHCSTDGSHQGSGEVLLMCCKVKNIHE
jgi:hypothetical protein